MAEKTNTGLVAYAKAQVGLPYWYGTYGQTATESLYQSKAKQYASTGYYTKWDDYDTQYGKRVHDCVGLIKGYLWSDDPTATPKYNAAQDKSANGMYTAATVKGEIAAFPKVAGLLVFKGASTAKITHVGIYDGSGYVYEAKGHAYGVVKTAYNQSDWNYWAQCPYTTDDTAKAAEEEAAAEPEHWYRIRKSWEDKSSQVGAYKSLALAKKNCPDSYAVYDWNGEKVYPEEVTVDYAASYDKTLAGTYKATTGLNVRSGAGTGKSVLVTIPKDQQVKNYGYYTTYNGAKWLYVKFTYDGITYTGFCSSKYLEKQ